MSIRTGQRAAVAAAFFGLTACGNGGSAVETRERGAERAVAVLTAAVSALG